MTHDRIQKAKSADGTEIAGHVQGEGPALVLVHGVVGDGDLAWEALVPHLADHFTCFLPSTRGRGLSDDNPDHSLPRMCEDVTAFVDSIGSDVGLVSWSGSGEWVLDAAWRSEFVTAVAAYEPGVMSQMGADDIARTVSTMGQVGGAAAAGELAEAVRAFAPWVCTDEEIAALEETDFYERWAQCIPPMLRFVQQDAAYSGPRSTDSDTLANVDVPVLLLRGQQTKMATWLGDSAKYLARHLRDAEVREMPGIGHFAPLIAPETLAREFTRFFEPAR